MGWQDTVEALRKPFRIIREEMPKFMNEPGSAEFKGVLNSLVPQDATDVGLMLMTGPYGKAAKLGGAALAGSTYSPDAEAGGVTKSLGWLLKTLREAGLADSSATGAVRQLQTTMRKTGNEHNWAGVGNQLVTSNSPDSVTIPAKVMREARDSRAKLHAHSHPRGDTGRYADTDVAPSFDDFQTASLLPDSGALIVAPNSRQFTYYKSLDPRGVNPSQLEDYAKWARLHKNDARGLDWAERTGLIDTSAKGFEFEPYDDWLKQNASIMALRDAEMQGKMKTFYNPGGVYVPEHGIDVPSGSLIDDFYKQVLDK